MKKERLSRRSNTEDFIKASSLIHNNFYSYEKTVYVKAKEKVIITCPVHGDFEVSPHHHKAGIKCRNCSPGSTFGILSKGNANAHKEDWLKIQASLYFLEIEYENNIFYKVGITTKSNIKDRLKEFPSSFNTKVIYKTEGNLFSLAFSEKNIIDDFKYFKYKPSISFRGKEECFSVNPLNYYYNL